MRMCDLADSVLLSRSGLTRLVDRLERDGLLRRESCASDARGAFAKLTPAGREKLASARATHLEGVRSLFLQHFSEEEQELLGDAGSASCPAPSRPRTSRPAASRARRRRASPTPPAARGVRRALDHA